MNDLRVVPANEAGWEDLQTVFGTRGDPVRCGRVPRGEPPDPRRVVMRVDF